MAAQKKISDIKAINVHAGHNPDGKIACGAIGLIKESTEARNIKEKVISMLRILGYTIYDCTVDNGTSQNDVLVKIVAKCNAHAVQLDISIHLNSGAGDKTGNGKTTGVEVYVLPGSTVKDIASSVCNAIAELGFKNRGVKETTNLYVLNKTTASAMLIECCFVDDADDVKLYDSTKIAEAIVYGITGRRYTYGMEQQVSSSSVTSSTSYVVRITTDVLRVRSGPGTSYGIVTTVKKGDAYTIVEEKNGWGRLKSDVGWISLAYTEKVC